MTEIYMIRHAEAEGNLYRRMHGQYDSLLTPHGYAQLEELARRFEGVHIDAVYSSDLFRTRETARAIYERKGLPLILEPRLRELAFGVWEDMTFGDVLLRESGSWRLFESDPWRWSVEGGETFDVVRRRITEAVADIAARNDGKTVAVFTHGCAIRAFMCDVLGVTAPDKLADVPYVFNTGVSRLICDGGVITMDYAGDASHLSVRPGDRFGEAEQKPLPDWVRDTNMSFVREAGSGGAVTYRALLCGVRAGSLELDEPRGERLGEGWITGYELTEELRGYGLGAQLLGQAVAHYRALGRRKLLLRAAEENAAGFFKHHGFEKAGDKAESAIFERNISVNR